MSDSNLDSKVIVVTGSGRGIGREIALLCASEGASVIVNDLGVSSEGDGEDTGLAAQVVAEIEAAGGKAAANTANIADRDGAKSLIDDAIKHFGRVDGVVNNAGILKDTIFHKMTHEEWDSVIHVNLTGAFNVSMAAASHFRAQGSGAYVHMTSTSGLVGSFGQANYSASKMGVAGLSRSIALDMQRFNVRSNCIAPFAWSRMTATIPSTTDAEKKRVERIKTMTAAKIAPLVGYLCSDAASEVSGQIFAVRKNEIFLFSQPRPVRSVHNSDGWTVSDIAETVIPSMKNNFTPLDRSPDVFCWDPI